VGKAPLLALPLMDILNISYLYSFVILNRREISYFLSCL